MFIWKVVLIKTYKAEIMLPAHFKKLEALPNHKQCEQFYNFQGNKIINILKK